MLKGNPTTNILRAEPSEEAISAARKLQNDLGINNIAFDIAECL
ncbi:hypothetical protein OFQ59_10180 [Brachyspira hyodysenteriae]|nr:hypothetical protein [Brachyspira hyodysenteriae]MCZ9970447.1 hypothetical protein [Brachyspira hyodysenteriae]